MKKIIGGKFNQINRKRIEKERAEERFEQKLEDQAQKIPVYKSPQINTFAEILQDKNKLKNGSISSFSQLL